MNSNQKVLHGVMNHVTVVDSIMPLEPKKLPDHPIWAIRHMQEKRFQMELAKLYEGVEF